MTIEPIAAAAGDEPAARPAEQANPTGARRWTASRRRTLVTLAFAVVILIPSMAGFVNKFREFLHAYQGVSEGAFAISPVTNYLLASLGFLVLLCWATANGMFRDVEKPKQSMLENERALDDLEELRLKSVPMRAAR